MQVRRTSFAVQASAVRRERMAKQNAKRAAHRDDHRKLVEAQDKILMLALSTGGRGRTGLERLDADLAVAGLAQRDSETGTGAA
jgi:hypothetical protein